jgi:hypothetical protein
VSSKVLVNYIDENDVKIHESTQVTGLVGDQFQTEPKIISGFSLKEVPENTSGMFKEEEQVVNYVYTKDKMNPVDPLDPEVEIDPDNKPDLPETQGLLSIDFVSSLNFGSYDISVQDQTYNAQPQKLLDEGGIVIDGKERPNYIQISDRRPGNERNGWQLAVTQKEQFENDNGHQLVGGRLTFSNQQLVTVQGGKAPSLQVTTPLSLVPGNTRTLLRAEDLEGTGTWIYRFGDADTARESIFLDIPRGANPEATKYTTTLIWELSIVP